MIRFSLQCGDCRHGFEAWFRSGDDFDTQRAADFLQCPACGSSDVNKSLMAPSVTGTKRNRDLVAQQRADAHQSAASSQLSESEASVPMAGVPNLPPQAAADPRVREVIKALRELKRRVTAEATYVGSNFADEARKMHFGEAELQAIYGEATLAEAKELLEEGIEVAPLPILPEEHN